MVIHLMTTTPRKPGTPLLTVEEVDDWRDELRKLKAQREQVNAKINDLEARLQAAQLFMTGHAQKDIAGALDVLKGVSIKNPARLRCTKQCCISSARIKRDGAKADFKRNPDHDGRATNIKNSHPNYIYTVLMRLVQQGLVAKEGTAYKPTPAMETG